MASIATKSDAPPQADLLPAVAKVTDRIEVKDENIGEGTLRVLALETPDVEEVRAETVAMMSAPVVSATADLRVVTGTRVNMRNGPGTRYSVVSRLDQGDEVEVLQDPGDGWVKLRVSDTGRIGWMADFLLASAN
ncbi:SH3 domain-containing protein [Oceanicola sp. 22II-s10i]|uniref:SH3 domain-containing protein n=1 Tax=Oceanicola sp. 22II-s10i TaxID=1317116 RepID=UPI0015957777|nr:SH3 domain-containing protein [Oceanicola sp. 22II-s10i]